MRDICMQKETSKINKEEERIICAAIWYDDGKPHVHMPMPTGIVIGGHRHHNCIATMKAIAEVAELEEPLDIYKKAPEAIQGFLTSKGRFVDRWQAMSIAYSGRQVTTKRAFTLDEKWLSEDFDFEGFPTAQPKRYYKREETPFNKLFSEDLY